MTRTKNILTLSVILTLIGGTAHANKIQQSVDTAPIVSITQQNDFVSIPLKTDFTVKDTPRIDRDLADEFDTDDAANIGYDLSGNFDANFGLIKTKNVKRRYKVKSALQPRGRYHKRSNSALGAGISSKF